MREIIIDDVRTLDGVHTERTSQDGMAALRMDSFDVLYMDHDLGPESEKDGYQMIKDAYQEGILPDHIILLTTNPVGRQNMVHFLIHIGYSQYSSISFKRCGNDQISKDSAIQKG